MTLTTLKLPQDFLAGAFPVQWFDRAIGDLAGAPLEFSRPGGCDGLFRFLKVDQHGAGEAALFRARQAQLLRRVRRAP